MRRVTSVILALTLAPVIVPAPPAAAAGTPLPSDATIYTRGHGWGHARGLGQWGARGMAQTGAAYTSILNHYYSGVTWGNRSLTEDIRVMVEESSDVVVTSDAPFRAAWSNGTAITSSDGTYRFLRVRYGSSGYRLERATSHKGPWSLVASSSMYVVFTRGSALLDVVFTSGSVRTYRGSIIARASSGKMRAINQLQLREYLYAVVPREMPSSWPAEALKSQAVAARTYAAYKKDTARARGNMFDICATTSCQVYGGYGSKSSPTGSRTVLERASTNKAIQDTGGKVLLYGGKPILAEYSSSTGGYSAPGNVAYQKAVPDPGDAVSPHHDWRTAIGVREIEAKWPAIGRLVDIAITKRNGYGEWGGRVLEMKLVGTAGSVTMSGNAWRSAFAFPTRPGGVQSNWFTIWYWRGDVVGSPTATISSGETATVAVQVKNTGSIAWSRGGYVRLAAPSGSRFSGSDWISPTRPAAVARNVSVPSATSVAPGEVAEFRVPIHTAGVPLGAYTETFTMVADGWSTMPSSFPVRIEVVPGWTEEAANLVTNGSFESRSAGWTPAGLTSGDGPSTAERREGARSFRFTGGGSKSIAQTITFAGERPRRFVLGGWNKTIGSSSRGGAVSLWARVAYTDGTTTTTSIPFSRSSHPWQYGEKSFTTSRARALRSITVGASYAGQTGQGFFDAVRLLDSPAVNPSFEAGLSGWLGSGLGGGDGATTATARDGSTSLAIVGGGAKRVDQTLVLTGRAYERVTVSAWTRADGPKGDGGPMAVRLTLTHPDGTTTVGSIDVPKTTHTWTRHESVVSFPKTVSRAVLSVESSGQTGTFFVDGIRVLRTLTSNASFESGLTSWGTGGFTADDGIVSSARDGAAGLRLYGAGKPRVRQTLATGGGAGTRFVVSGWNRSVGTSTRGGLVGFIVVLWNSDGTRTTTDLSFSGSPHPWTYREWAVTAPKRFSRIDLYSVFYDQRGGTYFDSVRLARV